MCDSNVYSILDTIISNAVSNNELFTAFDITKKAWLNGVDNSHWELKKDIHNILSGYSGTYDKTLVKLDIKGKTVEAFLYHPYGADTSSYKHLLKNKTDNVTNTTNSNSTAVSTNSSATVSCGSVNNNSHITSGIPSNVANASTIAFNNLVHDFQKAVYNNPSAIVPVSKLSISTANAANIVASKNSNFGNLNKNNLSLSLDKRMRLWIPKSLIALLGYGPGDTVGIYVDSANQALYIGYNYLLSNHIYPTTFYTVDKSGNISISCNILAKTFGIITSFNKFNISSSASVLEVVKA